MSETPTPPKPGLSPAAWSALAAIAVAVIGGAVTLTTNWWSHQPPKADSPAAPQATAQGQAGAPATPPPSGPAAPADPSTWTGSWLGSVQAPGEAPYTVQLTIAPGCALNAPCGTIRVPKCVGRLTLASLADGNAEFNVDDFDASSDRSVCKPGGGEVLRANADGTLAYTATYSGAKGVLRRP